MFSYLYKNKMYNGSIIVRFNKKKKGLDVRTFNFDLMFKVQGNTCNKKLLM